MASPDSCCLQHCLGCLKQTSDVEEPIAEGHCHQWSRCTILKNHQEHVRTHACYPDNHGAFTMELCGCGVPDAPLLRPQQGLAVTLWQGQPSNTDVEHSMQNSPEGHATGLHRTSINEKAFCLRAVLTQPRTVNTLPTCSFPPSEPPYTMQKAGSRHWQIPHIPCCALGQEGRLHVMSCQPTHPPAYIPQHSLSVVAGQHSKEMQHDHLDGLDCSSTSR